MVLMMDTDTSNRKKAHDFTSVFAKRLGDLMDGKKTGKKVTQQELGEYIGVKRQAVSEYRNGSSVPNADKLRGIAEFFGVSADYLLDLTDDDTPNPDLRAIYEDVGLSSGSIEKIKPLCEIERRLLNYVMERDFLSEFMGLFRSILITYANEQVNPTMDKEHYRQLMTFTVTQFMTSNFDKYFKDFLKHHPLLLRTIQKAKFNFTENNNNDEIWDSIWRVMESTPNKLEDLL